MCRRAWFNVASEERHGRLVSGRCGHIRVAFICNTPSAYAVISVLHRPVESAPERVVPRFDSEAGRGSPCGTSAWLMGQVGNPRPSADATPELAHLLRPHPENQSFFGPQRDRCGDRLIAVERGREPHPQRQRNARLRANVDRREGCAEARQRCTKAAGCRLACRATCCCTRAATARIA